MHRFRSVRLLLLTLFAASVGFHPEMVMAKDIKVLNPDVSAIVDFWYYKDDAKGGYNEVKENIAGFGHVHAEEEAHAHSEMVEGFNLRHAELYFSADVDPYFKGTAIAAIDTNSAEIEVAEIETTALPYGLKLKGGKFYSDFGYINAKHSHEWDFTDQVLVYDLLFGEHGLTEKGLQLSWLAPTPFYLLAGVEALQGDNEKMFAYHGSEAELPEDGGPRVGTGYLKMGPNLPDAHGLQFGIFGMEGTHQEEHDEDADGTVDHWMDGTNRLYGADLVYKYNSPKAYGHGNIFLQGEYVYRKKDLKVVQHDLEPDVVGNSLVTKQDGYYIQGGYGFAPRWRLALRWEQVGLTNETTNPEGVKTKYDPSSKMAAMIDFSPTEFSRIRLQGNHGRYRIGSDYQEVSQLFVQWMVSIGSHGAHKF